MRTSRWAARRWPSRPATSRGSGTCIEAGHLPRAVRYSLISVHYRVGLNHSDESLSAAAAAVERLDALVAALDRLPRGASRRSRTPDALAAAREAFGAALDDDLGISPALAVLFELVRDLNRRIDDRSLSTHDAARALGLLRDLDQVLGVLPEEADALDPETTALLEARAAARAARDWAASDRLRDELAERGVAVEDTRDGQRWRRLSESVHG